MSVSRRNTKKALTQQDKRSFYLVANDIFFGLVFAKNQSYYYKLNRNLLTSPSFTLYSSQTKAVIDYSNSKNNDDLSYILAFYSNMSNGDTFAFSNVTYVNDTTSSSSDLSGVYSFTSLEHGKIIKADLISVNKVDSKYDFYASRFFTKTPQISKNGGINNTQQKNNIIKNTIPNGVFSFYRMGVQIGNYLEFSGTINNEKKKLKVLDIFIDNDGFECIQVDSEIESENLIGSPVLINLYFDGEPKSEINFQNKTYGSCQTVIGITLSQCVPCQNESICTERSLISGNTSTYIENLTCDEITNTTIQVRGVAPQATQSITGITGIYTLAETVVYKEQIRPRLITNNIVIRMRNGLLVNSETLQNFTSIKEGTTLKISLQDSSLKNYTFDIFDNETLGASTLNATSTIVKNGTAGSVGSFISVKLPINKKVAYLKATNDKSLIFTINVS